MRRVGKISDPRVLRVITHPLRLRLYEALVSYGPATATRLAQHVPAAPGSLSYHLHQLADAGFIEEAQDLKQNRRERWWRAVPGGAQWSAEDFAEGPGTEEALAAAQQVLSDRQFERLREWQQLGRKRWGTRWVSAAVSSDTILRMTPADLRGFTEDFAALVLKWSARSQTARADEAVSSEAAEVFMFLHAFPFADPAAAPAPESSAPRGDHDH